MKKTIFYLILLLFIFFSTSAFAHDGMQKQKYQTRIDMTEAKKVDAMLEERLLLTEEQKVQIRKNHTKFKKELEKVFEQMRREQKYIRNVYLTGIPPYQANIRTSASKAKLLVLKQKAENLRDENRKNFEKILTPEQKIEFEKIKLELRAKRAQKS